jgi:hypothetical protein
MASVKDFHPDLSRRGPSVPDFGTIDANLEPEAEAAGPLELPHSPTTLRPAVSPAGTPGIAPLPLRDGAAIAPDLQRGAAARQTGDTTNPLHTFRGTVLAAACALGLIAAVAALLYTQFRRSAAEAFGSAAIARTGTATFESNPPGAEVVVDGAARGVTPLTVHLPVGRRTVEIRAGNRLRTLEVAVDVARTTAHYVDFVPSGETGEAQTGRVEIVSEPPGAQVRIDGVVRGTTPLMLSAVPAGERRIVVSLGGSTVTRTVQVVAGSRASMFASIGAAPGISGGWVAIKSPLEMQIFEGGTLLGTTAVGRLMLPAGRHDLELRSEAVGFRTNISVSVAPGQTANAAVSVPNGTMSINALPWADVFVDGRPAGTTPLANLSVPIGSHEVVWRHPQLGERRRTILVTASAPTRVGVDFAQ